MNRPAASPPPSSSSAMAPTTGPTTGRAPPRGPLAMRLDRLSLRFAVAVMAGAVAALLVTAAAGLVVLHSVQMAQSAERMRVVAHRIATTIEQRVDLGLTLSLIDETQREIERERASSVGIARIDVFGERGTRLFSTERISIGEPVPAGWLAADGTLLATRWSQQDEDAVVVGVPVVNSFNRAVGGVALVVAGAGLDDAVSLDRLGRLLWPGLALLVLCGVGTLVAGGALLRRQERALEGSANRLRAVVEGQSVAWGDIQTRTPVDAATQRLAEVLDEVGAADAAIRRLDETT